MQFTIKPNLKVLNKQYFSGNKTELVFNGFDSNIEGLMIFIKLANGNTFSRAIVDTDVSFSLDISNYAYVWFEYSHTDKEYSINLDIN